MSAAPSSAEFQDASEPVATTLLELVQAVLESCDDEREAVATVLFMLRSGRAKLCGNFRGVPIDDLT